MTMIDMILFTSAAIFAIAFGGVAQYILNPKNFSTQELSVMAWTLFGFVVGIAVADNLIIQNFF